MAIQWVGTGGLFQRLREILDVLEVVGTAQATDIPTEFALLLAEYTADESQRVAPVQNAYDTWRRESSFASALRTLAAGEVIEQVRADNEPEARNLTAALDEVLRQMEAGGQNVRQNAVAVSVTQPSASVPQVAASMVGPTGVTQQEAIPETITARASGNSLNFTSGTSLSNKLRADWPDGSGINRTATLLTASSGVLTNGSFDIESTVNDLPADWDLIAGLAGTDILLSAREIQTVAVSGTPTSGTYVLQFTNLDSEVQQTAPLAYNASGSSVQTALNVLDGVTVSVSSTGDSPNFTHTITFTDIDTPGDLSGKLVAISSLDTGAINITQTQAGSPHTHSVRSLQLDGDGATLHQLEQAVSLSPNTVYALSLKAKVGSASGGTVRFALVDGAGAVVNNDAGAANSVSLDVSGVGTGAFEMTTAFFQTPEVLPSPLYLEIKATAAITNLTSLYLDDLILAPASLLYAGGPYFAAFENLAAADGDDEWSLTVTNDFGGKIQTWWGRMFGGQLPAVPSDETIPD